MKINIERGSVVINWFMYKSYEFQRDHFPNVDASRWKKLYISQEIYEIIYQRVREICLEIPKGAK